MIRHWALEQTDLSPKNHNYLYNLKPNNQLENKRWNFFVLSHPIFWVVDAGVAPRLKYWMPIYFDTIEEMAKQKISFLVRIVLFLYLIGGIYRKNYHNIILLASFKINVSIQETKIIAWRSSRA